ncbi:hypothetical protein GCM10022198_22840 [Klugiella xanthotipulae]|uniref:DUF7882 domain-containing protein n=1 Tax=Klugiella xanthotipulae TaxID=244735 RepID=A0A543HY83_9MICO|nr:hypothetical protein [Klugiella xanthotipulae]TQM63316.1 hypothetical protein FB466_1576 [Klugiella xanthotipulae]
MGYLTYGSSTEYEIDDRALAHLKVVIASKLRRQECFFLSWNNDPEAGSGRIALWLAPNIPLQFRFLGSRAPELNRLWIEVLADSSNTPRGLHLLPESDIEAYIRDKEARTDALLAEHQ